MGDFSERMDVLSRQVGEGFCVGKVIVLAGRPNLCEVPARGSNTASPARRTGEVPDVPAVRKSLCVHHGSSSHLSR